MRPVVITNEMRGKGLAEETQIREVEVHQSFAEAVASVATDVPMELQIERIEDVAADVSVPDNVKLRFTRRGRLRIAAGVTVTVASPEHIIADPRDYIVQPQTEVALDDGKLQFADIGRIYPNWWGAVGDGSADDTQAILWSILCLEDSGGGILHFPAGQYNHTGLEVTIHDITIEGDEQPLNGVPGTYFGAILYYTEDSGTGILFGEDVGTGNVGSRNLRVRDLTIKSHTDADIAIRFWHPYHCHISNLNIKGNSDNDGSDNTGLEVDAPVECKFENIRVDGRQGTTAGDGSDFLHYGILHALGHSNAIGTSTQFVKCVVNGCMRGMRTLCYPYIKECVFQACTNYGLQAANTYLWCEGTHFEANDADVYFGNAWGWFIDCWFQHADGQAYCISLNGDSYCTVAHSHFNNGVGGGAVFNQFASTCQAGLRENEYNAGLLYRAGGSVVLDSFTIQPQVYNGVTLTNGTHTVNAFGVETVQCDTSGGNVIIEDFYNTKPNQPIRIVVTDATNNTTVTDNKGAGNKDMHLKSGGNETLAAALGGWLFCVADDGDLYEVRQ